MIEEIKLIEEALANQNETGATHLIVACNYETEEQEYEAVTMNLVNQTRAKYENREGWQITTYRLIP